ncbi:hypothetical protein [Dysosmobacter sp.]
MKDGVILINCTRGELTDIDALAEGIVHADHRTDILPNRNWFYLYQFRNVIMTQHMAFYTRQAVANMVRCGVDGFVGMARDGTYPTKL